MEFSLVPFRPPDPVPDNCRETEDNRPLRVGSRRYEVAWHSWVHDKHKRPSSLPIRKSAIPRSKAHCPWTSKSSRPFQIGRASCREKVWPYVYPSLAAVPINK